MSIPGWLYPVFCWLVAVMHINTLVCVEEWIYVLCPSALVFGNPICIEMHAAKERMGKGACVCVRVLSPVAVCGTCFSMPDLCLWVIFMVSSCLILNVSFHPRLIIQSASSQVFVTASLNIDLQIGLELMGWLSEFPTESSLEGRNTFIKEEVTSLSLTTSHVWKCHSSDRTITLNRRTRHFECLNVSEANIC